MFFPAWMCCTYQDWWIWWWEANHSLWKRLSWNLCKCPLNRIWCRMCYCWTVQCCWVQLGKIGCSICSDNRCVQVRIGHFQSLPSLKKTDEGETCLQQRSNPHKAGWRKGTLSLTRLQGSCGLYSLVAVDDVLLKFKRELVPVAGAGFQVQDDKLCVIRRICCLCHIVLVLQS